MTAAPSGRIAGPPPAETSASQPQSAAGAAVEAASAAPTASPRAASADANDVANTASIRVDGSATSRRQWLANMAAPLLAAALTAAVLVTARRRA
ncbi:MAG: hypothetical protein R3C39_14920 [Dehalococcoidia bacterium]